jgi:hypothetical protein
MRNYSSKFPNGRKDQHIYVNGGRSATVEVSAEEDKQLREYGWS